MKNLEKEMKNNNLINSYQILWKKYKEKYYDKELDLTIYEFNVIDEFMEYVANILEEQNKIEYIPNYILNEFDKI